MRINIAITITCVAILLAGCKKPEQAAPEPKSGEAPMQLDPPPEGEDIPPPPTVAAPPDDAEMTTTGLASKVLTSGDGTKHPTEMSLVTVHYTGWTTDGEMFDSSVKKGETATFPLNKVILGWREGVQLMVTGEIRRFWIPVDLAYQGRPGKPAGMLVFDVQLLSIVN